MKKKSLNCLLPISLSSLALWKLHNWTKSWKILLCAWDTSKSVVELHNSLSTSFRSNFALYLCKIIKKLMDNKIKRSNTSNLIFVSEISESRSVILFHKLFALESSLFSFTSDPSPISNFLGLRFLKLLFRTVMLIDISVKNALFSKISWFNAEERAKLKEHGV